MTPVRQHFSPPFSYGTCDESLGDDFSFAVHSTFQDALFEPHETIDPTPFSPVFSLDTVQSNYRIPPQRRLNPVSPIVSMTMYSPSRSAMRSTFAKKPKRDVTPGTQVGRWTKREHELFLEGLQRFGKSWKKISSLVHTRTLVQIRTHAQKYLQKQSRGAIKNKSQTSISSRDLMTCLLDTHRVPSLLDNTRVSTITNEYYTSPTAIEDDLLGFLHHNELWVPPVTQETSVLSHSASISAARPVVYPAITPTSARETRTIGHRPKASHTFVGTHVWL
ncbi:protein [Plasmopara halstedii]|uniref:Protein n=1 Tax=Plasmopara halstedii TaxID=4781 RepID=A0A0N7L7R3_PLAHL|nr:protein [Plasmopara halstedii]CEG47795.1 protein [Plasmopara halstedii]|eukprot:XP_024584164.1 protein [Plasmopara halstedii]